MNPSSVGRMRLALTTATVLLVSGLAAPPVDARIANPQANVIRAWNELALETVSLKSASDARAARCSPWSTSPCTTP